MEKNLELENVQQIINDLENAKNVIHDESIVSKVQNEISMLRKYYSEQQNGESPEMDMPEDEGLESFEVAPRWPLIRLTASGLYSYRSRTLRLPKRPGLPTKYPLGSQARIPTSPFEQDVEIDIDSLLPQVPAKPSLPSVPLPLKFYHAEDLRLDVDGRYPQMTASGTISSVLVNVHWVAKLYKRTSNSWYGKIWYKRGTKFFKYTYLEIKVSKSFYPPNRKATVTFKGPGLNDRTVHLNYQSVYSHSVEFEFDSEQGVSPVTSIQTHAHPNRPATLPNELLSIETVYRRAGLNVKRSRGASTIPPSLKGSNGRWSDNEMHDAMQTYWSRFSNAPQWALWTLFAKQHDRGPGLGGVMFDDIGPNHRQGTAIFDDSFIAQAPAGELHPDEWVKRMKFWTAVHEIGHAFNLAHSWQKEHPSGTPWHAILRDEPDERSFMNYPYRVSGGESAFFADFDFRFSDQELLFMRHAPEEFVQMGNANWFENHGFEWARINRDTALQLEVRSNRPGNEFEFLEPVNLELKFKNISQLPQIVDANELSDFHDLIIVVKKDGKPARQFQPFMHRCYLSEKKVLQPGEALYEKLFLSATPSQWLIDEPGYYTVQACLHGKEEDFISAPMRVRITPPKSWDEEYVAQDYFNEDVSRILAFEGSMVLDKGNDVLREVTDKLTGSRAAQHAAYALSLPYTMEYKLLNFETSNSFEIRSVADEKGKFKTSKPKPAEAEKIFDQTIMQGASGSKQMEAKLDKAVETVGHIQSKPMVEAYSRALKEEGKTKEATQVIESALNVYKKRNILKSVQDELKNYLKTLK